jgi:hypothetical protein
MGRHGGFSSPTGRALYLDRQRLIAAPQRYIDVTLLHLGSSTLAIPLLPCTVHAV